MAESICVGYARVSSKDQNEERQTKMLKEAGVPERYIFIDKESGRDYNRDKWNAMMTVIRKGDTVFVCSLDRLGRNYTETGKQWEHITKEIGADIVVLDMPILDTRKTNDLTGTLIADIVLKVLSYVAEKERINTHERQAQGIALAKKGGCLTRQTRNRFLKCRISFILTESGKCTAILKLPVFGMIGKHINRCGS